MDLVGAETPPQPGSRIAIVGVGRSKKSATFAAPGSMFIMNKKKIRHHTKSSNGCLACKARKVKCQETWPACRNCIRRGSICVYPSSSSHTDDSSRNQTSQLKFASFDATPTRSLSPPGWDGDETGIVLDCVCYYNTCVVPDMLPASLPFKREKIDPIYVPLLPKILQRLLIVSSETFRAVKDCVDPLSRPELCRYRGLCLSELTDYMQYAAIDPYGIALSAVLILMLSDMQLSCNGYWSLHLEAARKIIELRGGLQKCFDTIEGMRRLLANFVVIDVLTASTCSSLLLKSRSAWEQSKYLSILPAIEDEVLSSVAPCPARLLQAIVHINVIRASSALPTKSRQRHSIQSHNSETVRNLIEEFDAGAWAVRVSNYGRVLPPRENDSASQTDIAGLTSLALCYKSATLLYFLLSCRSVPTAQLEASIAAAESTLSSQIKFLLDVASYNFDEGLQSQMWKMLVWPLVIYMYTGVGWNVGGEIDHVRTTAVSLGSRSLLQATKLMETLREQRITNLGAKSEWDEVFSSRYAFVL